MSIKERRFQQGVTLVEQIIFIIVVGVGVVGVLSTLGPTLRFSADPQVKKQQLAIAESMLAEILHQPFTFCDPDDPNASTAGLSGAVPGCANAVADQDKGGAPLAGPTSHAAGVVETRNGVAAGTQFDNVADYGGYNQVGVTNISGSNAMAGFDVGVAVTRIGATYGLSAGAALQVDVTVTGGSADPLTLTGYRFRYAPRY